MRLSCIWPFPGTQGSQGLQGTGVVFLLSVQQEEAWLLVEPWRRPLLRIGLAQMLTAGRVSCQSCMYLMSGSPFKEENKCFGQPLLQDKFNLAPKQMLPKPCRAALYRCFDSPGTLSCASAHAQNSSILTGLGRLYLAYPEALLGFRRLASLCLKDAMVTGWGDSTW